MQHKEKNLTWIFLGLTLLAWALLTYPTHNYQQILSQGDHGRDLYCFQKTLEGQIPYRDYWWVYGPLMPYVYALFMKVLGVNILSVLIAKYLFVGICGVFIYFSLTTIIPASYAFLGACWFFLYYPDFFITYNHIGGIVCLMAIICCLLHYLKYQKPVFIWAACLPALLLMLIKLNFGIIALGMLVISTFTIDWIFKVPFNRHKIFFYALNILLIPLITFGVYFYHLQGLSVAEIRQCLPYMSGDQPYEEGLIAALTVVLKSTFINLSASPANLIFTILVFLSLIQTVFILTRPHIDSTYRRHLFLSILLILAFFIFNLHEFLISTVYYRMYWATPFGMMLMFIFLSTSLQSRPRILQLLFHGVIGFILIISIVQNNWKLSALKAPSQYLSIHLGKVYLGNHPFWIETVRQGTKFLRENLKADETFFALPYDPLYYYLTEKTSPTRQLIFFDHIKIQEDQERKILAEIEAKNVNWVLVSNRATSKEPGLGVLGVTYCPLIGKYIDENFELAVTIGDWMHEGGWGWNHGVKIYKRKK